MNIPGAVFREIGKSFEVADLTIASPAPGELPLEETRVALDGLAARPRRASGDRPGAMKAVRAASRPEARRQFPLRGGFPGPW
jgi:hypothetical protein